MPERFVEFWLNPNRQEKPMDAFSYVSVVFYSSRKSIQFEIGIEIKIGNHKSFFVHRMLKCVK